MKLKLIDKRQEAPEAYTFIFQPKTPITWLGGQFLIYTLPHADMDEKKDKRFFSIASAPFEKNAYITTRITDKPSSFKKALQIMPIGAEIDADGPSGGFTIGEPEEKLVFIAGGIGITAIRSILADLDNRKIPIKGMLLYANRDNNFIFKKDLEEIAGRNPDFKIHYFIEPERVTAEAVKKLVPDLQLPEYYVSGPEPMVEAMEKMLAEMGIADNRIKRDYFPGYDWP